MGTPCAKYVLEKPFGLVDLKILTEFRGMDIRNTYYVYNIYNYSPTVESFGVSA